MNNFKDCCALLVLAGSRTAEVEGISAAGASSAARRYTAVADAELLLKGPLGSRSWPLPPLSRGVSPALISYVASNFLGLKPLVLANGLYQVPPFAHICLEPPSLGPAACLSTGKAMDPRRVRNLLKKGFLMGSKSRESLLIAECVPGGTTTAQAALMGLGMSVSDLISGSVANPPVAIKKRLVESGLRAAKIGKMPSAEELLAAVGDPFQPVAVGLLLGARKAGQQVVLGGGCQMLAVLALALSELEASSRESFVEGVVLGTTSWLVEEGFSANNRKSALVKLINVVEDFFNVELLGLSTGLRFDQTRHKPLMDYEDGYIKEGVGAGAFALMAQLHGISCKEIVNGCEKSLEELQSRANSFACSSS